MKTNKYEFNTICENCEHATPIEITHNILCEKKGIVACDYVCHSFVYDPLKRKPTVIPTPSLDYIPLEDEDESQENLEESQISNILEKVDLDDLNNDSVNLSQNDELDTEKQKIDLMNNPENNKDGNEK